MNNLKEAADAYLNDVRSINDPFARRDFIAGYRAGLDRAAEIAKAHHLRVEVNSSGQTEWISSDSIAQAIRAEASEVKE